jgi:hypothetical protein
MATNTLDASDLAAWLREFSSTIIFYVGWEGSRNFPQNVGRPNAAIGEAIYGVGVVVYHCAAENGSVQSETFKTMERRLLRIIINPAMAGRGALACLRFRLPGDCRRPCFDQSLYADRGFKTAAPHGRSCRANCQPRQAVRTNASKGAGGFPPVL